MLCDAVMEIGRRHDASSVQGKEADVSAGSGLNDL